MIGIKKLFDFQEKCVNYLLNTSNNGGKNKTIVKAPTGAGKTIILIDFIDKYLKCINNKTVFIWLCPGKGNLEEQSQKKMTKHLPNRKSKNLFEVLASGFQEADTAFINWELVTNKRNKAITENERKNLFERIVEAHKSGLEFILIIDEEHSNDTKKAKDIIDSFSAKVEIRVSATAKKNDSANYYEVNEIDVIEEGLITKALYVNEGVESSTTIDNEHSYLIKLSDAKRKEIAKQYKDLGKEIKPLVLIQFPDMSEKLIEDVEEILNVLGYNYENNLVAKWMSEECDKINKDGIEENNAAPIFLLMKQAVATGWDCPRAKILVKLRENMSEDFTIQTIGRLRRMPEAKHYENDLLDNCYLYTFDEKYKESIRESMTNSYERKTVFLKEKCKTFTLIKEMKDLDYDGLGERETFDKVYKFFVEKYNLTSNIKDNKFKLTAANYDFSEELIRTARQGIFIKTDSILDSDIGSVIETRREVNTHKHGIELLHSIDTIKSSIGIKQAKLKVILERLFRNNLFNRSKLLKLTTKQFYAFIINNEEKLKEDLIYATSQMGIQGSLVLHPKTKEFKIPETEKIRYDSTERDVVEILSNAYKEYPSSALVEGLRSTVEILFENYCEDNDKVDWVYKNGDKGQEYFSIVYVDALQHQWLFYPDYIVKLKNGEVWIIETKGGEKKDGQSKNIDKQVLNKFEAFKKYASNNGIKWGFVRDKNTKLKINNTVYCDKMKDDNWKPISTAF